MNCILGNIGNDNCNKILATNVYIVNASPTYGIVPDIDFTSYYKVFFSENIWKWEDSCGSLGHTSRLNAVTQRQNRPAERRICNWMGLV
jgi:hypothetical protein